MADAERALCWLRGWVAPSHVSKELSTLAAHIDKRNVRIVKARDQDYHQVPSQDLGEFANSVLLPFLDTKLGLRNVDCLNEGSKKRIIVDS